MRSSFFLASRQYVIAYANCGIELVSVYADGMSLPGLVTAVVSLKNEQRSRNVYENKGPLRKTWERSANVYGNKGG